ncbi:hypothetical protein BHE74_00013934 [Ensete ventricosum]|nr:hypothetical protein GW17_00001839 [Ensete ventricosum]RWW77868.1 hypothetical protein BHE74_00013934 [Ensete ventricosum]RZR93360.1 hypothetical protein BHM03_00021848 [Ensete ventricosum]
MKEVIVSRKCAEAVLRGAQVYVPGVLACSSHVEKGDVVAVSIAVEQRMSNGGWGVGFTRGTVLQGLESGKLYLFILLSKALDTSQTSTHWLVFTGLTK